MNKAKLKSYAPQAHKDFIAAVTVRANRSGLADKAGKLGVAANSLDEVDFRTGSLHHATRK